MLTKLNRGTKYFGKRFFSAREYFLQIENKTNLELDFKSAY